ncbi:MULTISPECIES: hypothetical protein [unclassified Paraburkholderia]|uniref:hypothetical protein n=1 Tax=unclassified Paraburkholderia TaxID=2615204 RepID=UPI00161C20AE|nr:MULTISPECIES: hypothetical protein [unclassified Paraburkholderia]MBB5412824.1 hypothetical protein [Paraburkholderia sp. HC6.4b]MBB5454889.1 hypothetical protein [Paraburkholderia sp. Kb1A]
MTITTILVAAMAALSGSAHAAQSYDSYEALYVAQAGAVFGDPIKRNGDPTDQNAGVVYSYPGEPGTFMKLQAKLERKTLNIELWKDRLAVDGKSYRFAHATTFPGEHVSEIFPQSANVFIAARTDTHPPLLCVEGHGNGSGEAGSRYRQISLLVNPLARKPTFLHLPSLLSSCRAVVATKEGKLAFPNNSYVFDDAQASRVGLLVSYYTFKNQRFVPVPALKQLRLKFTHPEIPFQFSIQDEHQVSTLLFSEIK